MGKADEKVDKRPDLRVVPIIVPSLGIEVVRGDIPGRGDESEDNVGDGARPGEVEFPASNFIQKGSKVDTNLFSFVLLVGFCLDRC